MFEGLKKVPGYALGGNFREDHRKVPGGGKAGQEPVDQSYVSEGVSVWARLGLPSSPSIWEIIKHFPCAEHCSYTCNKRMFLPKGSEAWGCEREGQRRAGWKAG